MTLSRMIPLCAAALYLCAATEPLAADTLAVPGEYATIQAAIDAAVDGDTIEIAAGTYPERLTITDKSLTLHSIAATRAETVIDAEDGGRLCYISGDSVTVLIQNMSLVNGSGSSGGGIYVSQSSVTLDTCAFSSHDASSNGGGIYLANGATLLASESTFDGCTAASSGGACYLESGCTVTLVGSTFTNNQAQYEGGALYLSDGNQLIVSSSFVGNSLTYTSSSYTYGGAIRLAEGSATLQSCSFENNTHYLDNYDNYRRGGAIALGSSASISLTDTSFSGNSAGYGGALWATGSSSNTIEGGDMTANTARYEGGGVWITSSSTMDATDLLVDQNEARYYGGGMYLNSSVNHQFDNVTFTNNSTTETSSNTCQGAGLYATGLVQLVGCTFMGNTHQAGSYPEDRQGGGAYLSVDDKSTVTACTFTQNEAGLGGGLYINDGTVLGCSFSENTGWGKGGGAYSSSSTQFELCTFTNNLCDVRWSSTYLGGGGIYMSNGTLVDCSFSGNRFTNGFAHESYLGGGAVYANGFTLDLNNCTFENNQAEWTYGNNPNYFGGGAIYANNVTLTCSGTTSFTGNEVLVSYSSSSYYTGGGAIRFKNSTPVLTNVTFTANAVHFLDGGYPSTYSGGGAVNAYGGNRPEFTDCDFIQNEVTTVAEPSSSSQESGGGAILSASGLHATNCTFTSNRAVKDSIESPYYLDGGAIWVYPSGTSNVVDCTFDANEADEDGGAIYTSSSGLYISGSLFTGNACSTNGGALYGSSTTYVSNSSFCDNAPNNTSGSISDQGGNYFGAHCEGSDSIISVPEDYATITQATRHAIDGDTIAIAAGTYAGTIDLGQRDISLLGVDGAETTIVDLLGEDRRGIYAPRTDATGTIEGITIRNGSTDSLIGLGAYIVGSMTVRGCVFEDLELRINNVFSGGAALYSYNGNLAVEDTVFRNCVVRHPSGGHPYSGGGAIFNYDGALAISGCTFENCEWHHEYSSSSDSGGGAIYVYQGGPLTVDGSTFISCHATTTTDSSSYARGGAIMGWANGGYQLTNSTFDLCTAAGHGGALYCYNTGATIDGCAFTECSSGTESGGAIFTQHTLYATDTTFTQNSAQEYGGAVYASVSNGTLTNCTFTENSAQKYGGGGYFGSNCTLSNCVFDQNTIENGDYEPLRGGGAYMGSGALVEDCQFTSNLCVYTEGDDPDDIQGGALYCVSDATIRGTEFTGNRVEVTDDDETSTSNYIGGGAIGSYGSLTVENACTFTDNAVIINALSSLYYCGGGAICQANGTSNPLSVTDSTFSGNRFEVQQTILSGGTYELGGGAIYDLSGSGATALQLTNCTFDGNAVLVPAYDFGVVGGGAVYAEDQSVFDTCTLTNNYTDSSTTEIDRYFDGGAVMVNHDTTLTNCVFSGNHCGGSGGALASFSGTTTVTDCSLTGNGAYEFGSAGAIRFNDRNFTMTGTTVCSNAPTNFGGSSVDTKANTIAQRCEGDTPVVQVPEEHETIAKAIRFAFDGDTLEIGPGTWNEAIEFLGRDLSLVGVGGAEATIIDATGWGRSAIVADRSDGVGTIEGLTVTGANASGDGGGMRIAGSMTIRNCVVANNTSTGDGAGIYFGGGNVTLENVEIRANQIDNTWGYGGGVHVDGGSIAVTDTVFASNSAGVLGLGGVSSYGGGLSLVGAGATLFNVLFEQNSSLTAGGNLYAENSDLTADTVIFEEGSSDDGGGMYLTYSSIACVDTVVQGNTTTSDGGGMYLRHSSSQFTDIVVEGNTASGDGGGAYVWANVSFTDVRGRYTGNTAGSDGGGAYLYADILVADSTSVMSNDAGINGGGFCIENSTEPVLADCAVQGNTAGSLGGGFFFKDIEGENGAQLLRTDVIGNSATLAGGGIRVSNNDSKVTIVNCAIAENQADIGGGISNYDNRLLTLQEVDLYNNTAALFGGGLYDEGSEYQTQETVINECVVSGNNANLVGGGIYLLLREMAISNTAFCDNAPGQIVGFWTDYGGNTFGDIACFFDCNGNGTEDSIEVAEGLLEDCDGNGIPDICEIADGTAEDCDGDGVPDVCSKGGFFSVTSGTLPAVGYGVEQSLVLTNPPTALSGVTVKVEVIGDFSGSTEYIDIAIDGDHVSSELNNSAGIDCSPSALIVSPWISAEDFNTAALDGQVVLSVVGSIAVDASFCENGMVRISCTYIALDNEDCNENGLLDACEIAAGYEADCNENGVPDSCEIENGNSTDSDQNGVPDECECPVDLDGDFVVNGADLLAFLGAWGTSGPVGDFNSDGIVDGADLAVLLAAWGPCG